MTQYSSYDAPERGAKRNLFRPKYIVLGSLAILGCVMLAKPEALGFLQNGLNAALAKAMGAEEVMGYSADGSNGNSFSSFQKEDRPSGSLPSSSVPVRRLID